MAAGAVNRGQMYVANKVGLARTASVSLTQSMDVGKESDCSIHHASACAMRLEKNT